MSDEARSDTETMQTKITGEKPNHIDSWSVDCPVCDHDYSVTELGAFDNCRHCGAEFELLLEATPKDNE